MINKNYIAFSLIIDIELYKGLKHINCHLIFHQYQYLFLISKIKHYKDKYSSNSFKNFYFHVIFSNKNSPLSHLYIHDYMCRYLPTEDFFIIFLEEK